MKSAPRKIPNATSPKKDKSFFDLRPIKERMPKTPQVKPNEIAINSIGTNIVNDEINTPMIIAYKTNGAIRNNIPTIKDATLRLYTK